LVNVKYLVLIYKLCTESYWTFYWKWRIWFIWKFKK